PNYKWLSLQTLDGQLYRFTVHNPEPNSVPPQTVSPALQLFYMPEDKEQAGQIYELLKQQGIDITLVPEPTTVSESIQQSDRPILRLWSRASANYWQQATTTDETNFAHGLLLRTDPQVDLPIGFNPRQAIDVIDWHNTENAVQMIRQWLDAPPPDTIDPALKIEALLKELENPETKPRRRLAIGDRLAERGDPRKGVGVKEYEIIDYAPEVQRLLDELNDIKTEPPRRLEVGNLLAEMGDPRPGVGLDESGLPDIDWVEIPAGPFIYGEDKSQQTLDLPKFKISRYPVTNSQFQAFIDAGGYQDERWWQDLIKPEPKKPQFKQANRPRETVDWSEAVAFTRWLSEQRGVNITLPTEQQWEKAARGRDGRVYPWGNEFRSGIANHDETVDKSGSYNLQETSAVGIYPQGESPYQVADMAGNVWEWCLNDYDQPDQIDVIQSANYRVLRGGSWGYGQGHLRSAYRFWGSPDDRYYDIGFRLAQD
ncbi:MAG: formylglycine-generating enzyme family protein, partial [Candidatus Methylumidiphilus sp.]